MSGPGAISAENNRFERWFQAAARRRKTVIAILLGLLVAAELTVAWAYVAKRRADEQPVIDLVERLHVLRPVGRRLFADEYRFPETLMANYAGDINTAAGLRAIYEGDGLTGHRLRPDTVTSEVIWTWRATNAQGFVISDPSDPRRTVLTPKPDDLFRIVVLGGSTVEGDGASGSLNALPAKLWRELDARYRPSGEPARRFEVINAGVGAFYSDQEFLYYYSELQYLEPDLLVIYNGWNDLMFQNRVIKALGPRGAFTRQGTFEENRAILNGYHNLGATTLRLGELLAQRTLEFLDGFALVHTGTRAFNMLARRLANAVAPPPAEEEPFYSPQSVDRMIRNIRLILTINAERDIPTAWFLQPLVGLGNKPPHAFREAAYLEVRQPYIRRRKKFYARAEAAQRTLAAENAPRMLCAASLTDVFDGNPASVYEDFGHLFDIGNEIVARRLARELERCGLVRSGD